MDRFWAGDLKLPLSNKRILLPRCHSNENKIFFGPASGENAWHAMNQVFSLVALLSYRVLDAAKGDKSGQENRH